MVVIDVESSGLDPKTHSIVSLGALDLSEPENQFYDECRVWEGAKIDDDALAINGFSREEVEDARKKSEGELVKAFVAWATDRPKNLTLAAQNVSFDYEFVKAACMRAGIECPFAKRSVDIHSVTWLHMSEHGHEVTTTNRHSLMNSELVLLSRGLSEDTKPHNARTGALWHAEVLSRMAYNKKLLKDFESYDIPWQN
mgnify:CR=1 FL=1